VNTTQTLRGAGAPVAGASPERRDPARAGPLVLDRYRLISRLGTGGFGAVWLARDERLGRDVAVKAVPRAGTSPARSQREAVAAARLNHPAIVTLYEAGADAEGHYLVSELVEGPTLAELIAAGALSDRDVLRVGVALAGALAHAHGRGVVHRDVKPQNVIVPAAPQSVGGVAKLTDFGIALLAGDDPLTRTGDVVGTLAYMAPEQAEGRRVGAEADVYALALVLYEALAGRHPVRGAGPAATARRLGAVLPSLARSRRDLPEDLVEAIDRALLPDPHDRGALDELAQALEECLPDVSDEGGRLPQLPVERRRLRGAGRLAAALAAAALTCVAAALSPSVPPAAPVALGAIGAAVVLIAPRLGWLAGAGATIGWLAFASPSLAGVALVVVLAAALVPLLLWRHGRSWSAPAIAPLLGAATLAGAFPALAGQARDWRRRFALAALGYWWLSLAEAVAHARLYLGAPASASPVDRWSNAPGVAVTHVVAPLLTSGALALAGVWAVGAVVLPWVVRGRSLTADLLLGGAWAFGLATGASALAAAISLPEPRGNAVAAVAAGGLAVALRTLRGPDRREPPETAEDQPDH